MKINKKEQNFTLTGKLGDFIHMMFAMKHLCEKNNTLANVYLYDAPGGWEFGIETSYKELYDLVMSQPYVKSFQILTNLKIVNENSNIVSGPIEVYDEKLLKEGYIHLEDFMRSAYLYKNCWTEILSKTFDFEISQPYNWIQFDKIDPLFTDKIIINRRYSHSRINNDFPYNQIIEEYKGNVIFISTQEKDYDLFPYKDQCTFYQITDIINWFTVINSCALYIGNLSAPSSIASSLDKRRIIELPQTADIYHWIGEEKYSSNIGWFVNNNLNYINFN
jgi:hypothetical protein